MQNTLQADESAPEHMDEGASKEESHKTRGEFGGLLLVGLFKISKSLGCLLIGAMCLNLIHRDLGGLAMQTIGWLGLNPEGHIAGLLLDKADLINAHDLRVTGALSFAGTVLYGVEGTGLMLRKVWAEYFTVVLTGLGLPWEIYEMFHRFTLWKFGLFVANVLVLAYLLWILRNKRQQEREHAKQ